MLGLEFDANPAEYQSLKSTYIANIPYDGGQVPIVELMGWLQLSQHNIAGRQAAYKWLRNLRPAEAKLLAKNRFDEVS